MNWFSVGFALPLVALWHWGAWAPLEWFVPRESPWVLGLLIVAAPLASAYAAARASLLLRPRRLFDRRVRGRAAARALLGVGAGLVGVVLLGGSLVLVDRWAPDFALAAGAGAVAGLLATLPLARQRRGACLRCGYDLSSPAAPGQAGFGVCPECGADSIALAAGVKA